jgi:5-(carboxyamino)imidazole ribonucleotide synthase
MMGEVAHDVDVRITVLATSLDDAAVATCDAVVVGDAKDAASLDALARCVDVVTFDHELVDLDQIAELERRGITVRPSSSALAFAVDKAHQRRAFFDARLPVPRFLVVNDSNDSRLADFLDELDAAPVVKSSRGGYDGRGVLFPQDRAEALAMIDELVIYSEVVVEERLDLRGEVAQLLARGVDGSLAIYPLVSTVQSNGMCIEVDYPAQITNELAERAASLAEQIASLIDVVGILAIEFFVTSAGLAINEVALRPHNSGHWTIEGTRTSQFANHLLAVSGSALGDAAALCDNAVMVNVVGADEPSSLEMAKSIEGAYVHDYGKSWRPGRKLGHVTVLSDHATTAHVRAWESARAYGTRTREA